jgi:DNA repair protein RecN (Recombination protein N)
MLRFLSVRNLSVIDHLELDFEPGLNVLTGETGAGKSVLVEAIGLLVGGRASAELVRTGEPLATVQAIFETPEGRDVIVRREVSAQGRSRGFIDDVLATSAALKELGGALLELHGQHEHQSLLEPAEHVDVLDAFAGHSATVDSVAARYAEWREAADALDRTQLNDREKRARVEMASFQLQEIEKVAPASGEDERLAVEKVVLGNADRLSRLANDAYAALYEGDGAVLAGFGAVFKRVGELAALDDRFQSFTAEREDLKARLEDLALFLRRYAADLEASPERLQAVEDRLAALERVKRRYGPTLEMVLEKLQDLRRELRELGASEEQIAMLQDRASRAQAAFERSAHELSQARAIAGARLAAALGEDLKELAMPACRIEVRQRRLIDPAEWSRRGVDEIELFISPNPGEEVRPLARIASGGELSRIMLALRIATARGGPSRTMIFDEVDAGIGGAAADAVGARLQALATRHQVLCVTHLAQIAARAGAHFALAKQVKAGRTLTTAMRLDDPGREAELGRMIAGAAVSAQVLASAREMLQTRQRSESQAKGESESRRNAKAKGKGKRDR